MNRMIKAATLLIVAMAPAASTAGAELSPFELKIWNDESFQRQFIDSYKSETDIEPRVTQDEREDMEKVLKLISDDEMDKALALLVKRRNDASSAVFDFTIANIHFQRDELEPAVDNYAIAVEKFPKFRRAWRNMALIHVRQSNWDKALPALTKVIELGGGDAITYGLMGFAYSSVENDLSAETAYRMAILLDPVTMDWKMGLARSFFKQERYADAASLCKLLLTDNPDRTDLWLLQANAYIGLNQPLKAAENYEIVDRLGASTVDSLNMLSDIYINAELFDLAVDTYVRAMDLDSNASPARAIRGARVLTAQGAMEETQALIEHIDRVHGNRLSDEDRKGLLKIRARIAVAQGAGDEEARVLEEIVELDPLDGEALILLGQHASRQGNNEKAAFLYERAANIEGFEADAKVRHAQLLVSQNKYQQALPLLRRAQTVKPRDSVQDYLDQVERVANRTR